MVHEPERKIRLKLKREATTTAIFRGHKMEWKGPFHYSTIRNLKDGQKVYRSIQDAACQVCGAWVQTDTHPPPNGIDIAGTAVSLTCPVKEGEE